jgi:uncharacterized membrane protein
MLIEAVLALVALAVALWMQPWRMLAPRPLPHAGADPALRQSPLLSPLLASLVLLPWFWALPTLHAMPLQLQLSGACLVLLMLGWPLAVPTLLLVGLAAALLSPTLSWEQALGLAVWQGIVPATLSMLLGAGIRRFLGERIFVYVLGRAFLGTAACLFLAGALSQWAGHVLPTVGSELSLVARWLMAWGDAMVTGMLCAIFVAFKPDWLATWSDALYLKKP